MLLALISPLPLMILGGIFGNEWAWKNKKWDSVEHFQNTQKTWFKVGLFCFIFVIIFYILLALLFVR
ncbi:MAG: hypothetical protein FWF37_05105 [Chloroflexi bacterium]|nr:hypothetical protein [Chloroflexota bacterium]